MQIDKISKQNFKAVRVSNLEVLDKFCSKGLFEKNFMNILSEQLKNPVDVIISDLPNGQTAFRVKGKEFIAKTQGTNMSCLKEAAGYASREWFQNSFVRYM